MTNPFLSILVPCYNVAAFLPKTIQSLRDLEDADDVEFIMVNDGSKDNSLVLLREFEATDKRVVLIDQPNQGVAKARNNGMKQMHGEYLLLLDGDDYLDYNAVTSIKKHLQGADALLPNIRFITEPGTPIPHIVIPEGCYAVEQLFALFKLFPVSPQLVYRSSIIKEHNLQFNPEMKAGEVFDFTLQHLAHCQSVATTNQAFYNYVFHPASATHKPNTEADKTVVYLLDRKAQIQTAWSNSLCLNATIFKLITSFTYNKYLRSKLTEEKYIRVIQNICSDKRFKQMLNYLLCRAITQPKIWVLACYLRFMPIKLGYKLAANAF